MDESDGVREDITDGWDMVMMSHIEVVVWMDGRREILVDIPQGLGFLCCFFPFVAYLSSCIFCQVSGLKDFTTGSVE